MRIQTTCLWFIVVTLLQAGGPNVAHAMCALQKYTVTGVIQDDENSNPIKNATVFVFLDDYRGTSSRGYSTRYPDFFTSLHDGTYQTTAFFDPYNGSRFFIGAEKCNRKPRHITVFITREGYLTRRRLFWRILLKSEKSEDGTVLRLARPLAATKL